jgi:hypothetical protein
LGETPDSDGGSFGNCPTAVLAEVVNASGTYILNNAEWLASSIIEPSEAISNKYSIYPALQALFDQTFPLKQAKLVLKAPPRRVVYQLFRTMAEHLDAALVGMVLVIGTQRGFITDRLGAAWKKLISRLGLAG